MKGLLKEEFYKSNHGVTQYVCLAISICFFFLMNASQLGAVMNWQVFGYEMISFNAANFCLVFVLVFVCGEFGHGTIKNYCAVGISKGKIFLAKLIKVGVMVFALIIINMLLSFLFFEYTTADSIDTGYFIYFTFYNILLLLEFICIGVSLAFLVRNVGGYIGLILGVGVLYSILLGFSNFAGSMGSMEMPDFSSGVVLPVVTRYLMYLYNLMPQITIGNLYVTEVPLFEKIFIMAAPVLMSAIFLCWAYLNFKRRDLR